MRFMSRNAAIWLRVMRLKRNYLILLASGLIICIYTISSKEQLRVSVSPVRKFSGGKNVTSTRTKSTAKAEITPKTGDVIILTYMRSGSSLTGNIIQANPDVFYFFEPFRDLEKQFGDLHMQHTIHYRDNRNITIQSQEEVFQLYIKTMKTILSCRFEDLDNITLQLTNMKRSKTTMPAFTCIWTNQTAEPQWERLLRCHQRTNTSCRSALLRTVKTIRLWMQHVEVLLASDPNLKIIHLVRDPRAIISSRLDLKYTGKIIQYDHLCSRIMEDLEKSRKISKQFPGRILTVRYEDLAKFPIATARQMYAFLGLQMNSDIEQYIWNITHADLRQRKAFETFRPTSTEYLNAWRQKLGYQTIVDIENTCTRVLDVLGYRRFQSKEEVRNFNVSSTYKLYDPDLMKVYI